MIAFSLLLPLVSLAAIPPGVYDCTEYLKTNNSPECKGQGVGCVEGVGWYSKDNTVTQQGQSQRVNAVQICQSEGYEGVSQTMYGGNWGHICRHPGGSRTTTNKAGGQLTDFGFTVTWQCQGKGDPVPQPTPKPTPEEAALPQGVVDCGAYLEGTKNNVMARECHNKGSGCRGEGWFSKDNNSGTNARVNAVQICRDQGFEGVEAGIYGGNWGDQCRFPGTNNSPNKAGGQLTQFGFTVTWKCEGERDNKFPNIQPTPEPTSDSDLSDEDFPRLPEHVVDCGNYNIDNDMIDDKEDLECHGEGVGCVGDHWYSKDSVNHRVNADAICKEQGYRGVTEEFGGNWGHICRYPGSQQGNPNKAGGDVTELGYTVTWRCELPRLRNGQTSSPTVRVTPEPSSKPDVSDLPENVVYCGDHDGEECEGQGVGCVTTNWFSKVNKSEPNQRINAEQVCQDNGYGGVAKDKNGNHILGGNYGHQCRFPGASVNSPNRAGGAVTALGFTVSWQCFKGIVPTSQPTVVGDIVDCGEYEKNGNNRECINQGDGCVGDGWFSHDITGKRINAQEVCIDNGYSGVSNDMYGGNWGHECRFPGTNGKPNNAGGQLNNFGYTVTWKCVTTDETIQPTSKPTPMPSAEPTEEKTIDDVIVDCEEYADLGSDRECLNMGDGCVTKGWFSKDNTVQPFQRFNADEFCQSKGYIEIGQYGGNWGHQCRFPGTNGRPNNAGGDIENLGFTVSFQCVGGDGQPTMRPTQSETNCGDVDDEGLCDLFDFCIWNPEKKGGRCEDKKSGSTCDDEEKWDSASFKKMCKNIDDPSKKSCQQVGCKFKKSKNGKPAMCASSKSVKCKKVDTDTCCKIPGCDLGDGKKPKCDGKGGW